MTRKPILSFVLILLASVNLMAQTLPQGVKKLASMGGTQLSKLATVGEQAWETSKAPRLD